MSAIRILQGDCRDVLRALADNSVHCCVTSPPYYGLRSYLTDGHEDKHRELGLEQSPDEYVARMVAVFREVRRVLRDAGTCWLNIGDAYESGARATRDYSKSTKHGYWNNPAIDKRVSGGMKPKDLLMMPARVVLALQADGWFIRSQLPWIKRSCMPESCMDRPTSAIEYVFLLTKSPTYYWDAQAVAQQGAIAAGVRAAKGGNVRSELKDVNGRPPEYWNYTGTRNFRNSDLFFDSLEEPHGLICDANGDPLALDVNPAPFAQAHFATFPARLVEPLIKASTSERGCCANCGAQWLRVVETERQKDPARHTGRAAVGNGNRMDGAWPRMIASVTTADWSPSCQCNAPTVPATVLDPFGGAGTTGLVASRLRRDAILIELNADYVAMAQKRIDSDMLVRQGDMFMDVAADAPLLAEAAE